MATLSVRRDIGYADKLRKYRIFVNDSEIGQLAEGAVLHQDVGEGPHTVEARIDWCSSRPLKLDALTSGHVVVVRSSLRGWRVVLALWYLIFNRQDYLTLELQSHSGV
ncbi:MAG: hypothetical protein Q8S02_12135 [Hydrogenophaga sp.]|nr:hypothetical protein [Hydrogenophaga sp.]